jgi:hypothetical protein
MLHHHVMGQPRIEHALRFGGTITSHQLHVWKRFPMFDLYSLSVCLVLWCVGGTNTSHQPHAWKKFPMFDPSSLSACLVLWCDAMGLELLAEYLLVLSTVG